MTEGKKFVEVRRILIFREPIQLFRSSITMTTIPQKITQSPNTEEEERIREFLRRTRPSYHSWEIELVLDLYRKEPEQTKQAIRYHHFKSD